MKERQILIIDDDKTITESLHHRLKLAGYHLWTAHGRQAAEALINRQPYHAVVFNVLSGISDNLDLIQNLQHDHPKTPIIIVSHNPSAQEALIALRRHIFDYLGKPLNPELFMKTLENACEKFESELLREDLAAMVAHDIKVPLTSIMGFASILYDQEAKTFHPKAHEYVLYIQANGQRVLALIENFLATCRIEAGTFHVSPGPVNIGRLVLDVIESCSIEATRRRLSLESIIENIPETIVIDETLIYRAICNLIQNALKYGYPIGPVTVRVFEENATDSPLCQEAVCVEVINYVDAIVPDALENVFSRYHQLGSSHRTEGHGLGLYVVSAIITAHEGLACASLLDDGSRVRFAIYLPLKNATVETT